MVMVQATAALGMVPPVMVQATVLAMLTALGLAMAMTAAQVQAALAHTTHMVVLHLGKGRCLPPPDLDDDES
jgi:hypothetical protein